MKSTTATTPQQATSIPAPTVLPFVEIQEEYTDDGKQVYGKAVDISSKLQSLWKHEEIDRRKEEQKYQSDDEEDDEYGVINQTKVTTDHVVNQESARISNEDTSDISSPPKAKKPEVTISDQEYDRISKRLEELALLEEQESQQPKQKVPLSQPKKTNSSKKATTGGAFKFQKGFLNAKPKKASIKTTKTQATAKIDTPQQSSSEPAVTKKSKITIDTSKNTIQEIPKEGNQNPVPPKQSSSSSSLNFFSYYHVRSQYIFRKYTRTATTTTNTNERSGRYCSWRNNKQQ